MDNRGTSASTRPRAGHAAGFPLPSRPSPESVCIAASGCSPAALPPTVLSSSVRPLRPGEPDALARPDERTGRLELRLQLAVSLDTARGGSSCPAPAPPPATWSRYPATPARCHPGCRDASSTGDRSHDAARSSVATEPGIRNGPRGCDGPSCRRRHRVRRPVAAAAAGAAPRSRGSRVRTARAPAGC